MVGDKNKAMKWLLDQPDGEYEIKPYKAKRSLTANAYFWVLVDRIAQMTRLSGKEVHDKLLADNLNFVTNGEAIEWMVSDKVPSKYNLLQTGEEYWFYSGNNVILGKANGTYYVSNGTPQSARIYFRIKGSHEMNTAEMARLIDQTVEEAKALGIETMTPAELARLKEAWHGEHTSKRKRL